MLISEKKNSSAPNRSKNSRKKKYIEVEHVETHLLLFGKRIHAVLNNTPWFLFQTTVADSRQQSVYKAHYLSDLCRNRSQIARTLLGTAEQAVRSVRNNSERNENRRWSLKAVNNC